MISLSKTINIETAFESTNQTGPLDHNIIGTLCNKNNSLRNAKSSGLDAISNEILNMAIFFVNSRGHSVRFWAPVGFACWNWFFGLKLFFDQLLVKKKWVPFFPAKIKTSGGHFENYYHKRINCWIFLHNNDRNMCDTSFPAFLESRNPILMVKMKLAGYFLKLSTKNPRI